MSERAEQVMMAVVLLDSAFVFVGLVYLAIRKSRQNSN